MSEIQRGMRTLFVYGVAADSSHRVGVPVLGDSVLTCAVNLLRRASPTETHALLELVAHDLPKADRQLSALLANPTMSSPAVAGVELLQRVADSCRTGGTSLAVIPGNGVLVAEGTPEIIEAAKPLFEYNNLVGAVVMACGHVELYRRLATKQGSQPESQVNGVARPTLVATLQPATSLDLIKLARASLDDAPPWSIVTREALVGLWRVQGEVSAEAEAMQHACSQLRDGITKLAAGLNVPTCSYVRVVRADDLLYPSQINPPVSSDGDASAVMWAAKYLRRQLQNVLGDLGWCSHDDGGLAPPRAETWIVAIAWEEQLMDLLAAHVPTSLASRFSTTIAKCGCVCIPPPADAQWLSSSDVTCALRAVSDRVGIPTDHVDGVGSSASDDDTVATLFLAQVVEPAARKWLESRKTTKLVDQASVIRHRWQQCLDTAQTVEHVVDLCDDVIRGRTPPHTHMSSVRLLQACTQLLRVPHQVGANCVAAWPRAQILRSLGVRRDTWCRFCEATPQPALQRQYHDDILAMLVDFTHGNVDTVFDTAGADRFRQFRSQVTSGPFQSLDRDVITRLVKRAEYEPTAVHGVALNNESKGFPRVCLDAAAAQGLSKSAETAMLAGLAGIDMEEADSTCWWFHATTWGEAIDLCDGTAQPHEDGSLDFGPSGMYLGDSFPAAVDWSNSGWMAGRSRERAVVVFAIPEAARTAWVHGAAFGTVNPPSAAWAHTVCDSRSMRGEVVYAPTTEAGSLLQHGRAKKRLRMPLSTAIYGPLCRNPTSGASSLKYYTDKRSNVVMQLKVRPNGFKGAYACCKGVVFLREGTPCAAAAAASIPGGTPAGAGAGAGASADAGAGAAT